MFCPVVVGVNPDAEVIKITPEMHQEMLKTLAQIIQHFNLDWKVLQALMITTGAVISGSAVLVVLHTGDFVPQDLDIYVTLRNFITILVFLNERGYVVQIPLQDAMINNYTYMKSSVKLTLKDHKGNKIDLIVTTEPQVIHTITQFHSMCVMNYISYYGIVCMYPEWMMCKKALVKVSTQQQVVNKYRGCGFTMVYTPAELPGYEPNHTCGRHQCCPKTRQELHDHITLFILLEDEGLNIHTKENRVGWVLENWKDIECATS